MVRFKNRYLIVEFLPSPNLANIESSLILKSSKKGEINTNTNINTNGAGRPTEPEVEDSDEEDVTMGYPEIPFILPTLPPDLIKGVSNSGSGKSDDGALAIYRAVRGSVQDVFGDEGWGRVSSNFKVVYHSPLTSLALLRIARPHIHPLHAGLTFVTRLNDKPVIPRVVGISGTIKKAQGRMQGYHRRMIAVMLAGVDAAAVRKSLESTSEKEKVEIAQIGE